MSIQTVTESKTSRWTVGKRSNITLLYAARGVGDRAGGLAVQSLFALWLFERFARRGARVLFLVKHARRFFLSGRGALSKRFGLVKSIVYDISLLVSIRHLKPLEERDSASAA